MGLFSRFTNNDPEPFGPDMTPEELDLQAEKWGRRAREAAPHDSDTAKYCREARAHAQKEARRRRGK